MFHMKHCMKRVVAAAVGVVFCSAAAASAFLFPTSARADSLPETAVNAVRAYDTFLHDLFTKSPVWYTSPGAQVAFAQLAVLSPYTDGGIFTPSDGYSYYYSGVSYDQSGNAYVGSGCIFLTSEARTSVRLYSEQLGSSIFIYNYATDPDNSPWIVPASSHGLGSGYMWYGAPMSGFYQGEPFTYLAIGESTSDPTGNRFALVNDTYCYCHFYSPSAIDSYVKSAVDTTQDDAFSAIVDLQHDLHEDFPDVDPDLFMDPQTLLDEPETSDTTENGEDQLFTLPPEWLHEYEAPTETLPGFDVPTDSTFPEPEPDIQAEGLNFWADLWTALVTRTGFLPYIGIIVGLSVLEFILWNLGSGKKGE